jgi:hypothetical protein
VSDAAPTVDETGEGDDETFTVADAFETFGEVTSVGYTGATRPPRVHDGTRDCRFEPDHAEPVAHRGELPLSVTVCRGCDPTHEVEQDDHGTSPIRDRRICGAMGCTDEAFVIVQHPEHGRRAVCPDHRRDYPVVEEVDA